MAEKTIEKKLKDQVKLKGGRAIKFFSPFETGYPDRLILLPGGRALWAELKSKGKDLKPNQKIRKYELEKLGFRVYVISDQETLNDFLSEL